MMEAHAHRLLLTTQTKVYKITLADLNRYVNCVTRPNCHDSTDRQIFFVAFMLVDSKYY